METERVLLELERALNALPGAVENTRRRNPGIPDDIALALASRDVGENLRTILTVQPELAGNLMMSTGGGASFSLSMRATDVLIRRASKSSAKEALDWFARILTLESSNAVAVTPVWGVDVSAPVTLGASYELVSLSSLPSVPHPLTFDGPGAATSFRMQHRWNPPTTAIIERFTVQPIFYKADHAPKSRNELVGQSLHEIRRCLMLSGPTMIDPDSTWFQFENADLVDIMPGARMGTIFEIEPFMFRSFEPFDAERAADISRAYLGVLKDHRNIQLALDRFERGMRRMNPGDAAVELCIALESLLSDPGDQGEITYKVALRSAQLLGGDLPERAERRDKVKALYGLRSNVVHGRTLPTKKIVGGKEMTVDDLVKEGFKIAAQVIARVIGMKGIPDWRMLELGG